MQNFGKIAVAVGVVLLIAATWAFSSDFDGIGKLRSFGSQTVARRLRGAPQGGADYTFALPGNQAYNILPGNLYLPAQNSGYTVTYQKSRRLDEGPATEIAESGGSEESSEVKVEIAAELSRDGNQLAKKRRLPNTTGQGISAPRPGGYAFTLPANKEVVINPGNLQLKKSPVGYSIVYANSS